MGLNGPLFSHFWSLQDLGWVIVSSIYLKSERKALKGCPEGREQSHGSVLGS